MCQCITHHNAITDVSHPTTTCRRHDMMPMMPMCHIRYHITSHMPRTLPPPADVMGIMETPFSSEQAQHKVAELALKLQYQEARAQLGEELAEHYKKTVSCLGVGVGVRWGGVGVRTEGMVIICAAVDWRVGGGGASGPALLPALLPV